MAAYVFCVKYDRQGPHASRFFDVTGLTCTDDFEAWKASIQVQRRMNIASEEATAKLLRDFAHLPLLARYQGGVYLLRTEEDMELDADMLNKLLAYKHDNGELDSFLREARIY